MQILSIIIGIFAVLFWGASCYYWHKTSKVKFEPVMGTVIMPNIFNDYFDSVNALNVRASVYSSIAAALTAATIITQALI